MLNNFFKKKITIAKWQFNLFGVVCVFLGVIGGFYLTLSGVIPKIFAADEPASKTVDTNIDFSDELSSSTLTDYQVLVSLNTAALISDGHMQADCDDIRFYDSDNSTPLNYWIESGCNTANTKIWVKIPLISSGNRTIHVHYDDPDAIAASDGDSTFLFFDDFNVGNFNGWTNNFPGFSVIDGVLTSQSGVVDRNDISRDDLNIASDNWAMEARVNRISDMPALWLGLGKEKQGSWWTNAQGYSFGLAYDIQKHYDGGNDAVGDLATYSDDNSGWMVASLTKNGSELKGFEDGAEIMSTNDSEYSQPFHTLDIYGYSNNDQVQKIDWIFIRKHAATEPTVNVVSDDIAYPSSAIWESPTDSNANDMVWNGGWGNGTDDSTAFSADIADVTSDENIKFEMRVASSEDNLSSADYITLGTATSNTFTKTKAQLDSLGLTAGTDRYFQVRATLAQSDGNTAQLDSITINYLEDKTAPEHNAFAIAMKKVEGGATVPDIIADPTANNWINGIVNGHPDDSPYFSWTEASEEPVQSDIKGYCLYLGTDPTGNPGATGGGGTKGLLGTSPMDVTGTGCEFITSGTSIDFATESLRGETWLTSSTSPYYLNIKAIDNNNNVFEGASTQFQFRFDNTLPNNPAYFSLPGDFISTKEASFVWPIIGENAPSDEHSGVAGLQYRIGNMGTWYGDAHTGFENSADLLANDGIYTTQEIPDFTDIQEGANFIYLRTWDLAGNVSFTTINGTLKVNSEAPSMPLNLTVTPENNPDANSYAFSWDAPETFTGQVSNITYCYTVNTLPSSSTCAYTEKGATSLSADAFATNPGQNTLYLVAKSESGSINYDVYAFVYFTYSGSAPGIPRNTDVADISIKATSNWKLAISWDPPTNEGAGIEAYNIYRSETNTTCSAGFSKFSEIGTTAGTSYADMGLDQKKYYYCLKACDSANNCSAASATISGYPNGKYIEAAELTSSPSISGITTKRATISWTTARSSDSKVAYGEKSSDYYAEEPSNSEQVTDHEINLTNLSPGKTYYFRAKWTDEDGNTGTSSEKAFKTDPAPTVKDVQTRNINLSGAMIDFTSSGAAKVKVYYGTSTNFGGSTEVTTASSEAKYSAELTGLLDGTKYYYRLNSFDSEGDEYDGTILDFTTLPRPKISNVKVQQVMDTAQPTVLVTWDSNTEISSIASYYPEGNIGEKHDEVKTDLLSGAHSIVIKGLFADTPYVLVVRGVDKVGNEAISDSYRFNTASDTRPPAIADLNVEGSNTSLTNGSTDQNISQLVVSWNTDEPASSQVEFGEGASTQYPQKTQEDANLTYNHLVVISGLTPSKVYHLRAVSLDKAGNTSPSVDMVAITPKESESALNLVITNLQQVFGFLNGN